MRSDTLKPPLGLTEKIGTGLVRLAQGMRGMLWTQARQEGLSPSQAQVLLSLCAASDPLTVGGLAEQFGISPPTASELVGNLERKGLLERRHSATDRRQVRVHLTLKGTETADRLIDWNGLLAEGVDGFSQPDREAFYRMLLTLLASLERAGVVAVHGCATCAYFSPCCNAANDRYHHCSLNSLRMLDADLRLDCPDFVPAS